MLTNFVNGIAVASLNTEIVTGVGLCLAFTAFANMAAVIISKRFFFMTECFNDLMLCFVTHLKQFVGAAR